MIRVNLIPAHRRARQQARRRRAVWFKYLRGYTVLLAVGCGLAFLPARADAPSLESSIARIDRRVESKTKELDEIRRQSNALGKQLDLARAVGEHPDWSSLLGAVARCRGDLAVLESVDLAVLKDDKRDKPAGASPTPGSPAPGSPAPGSPAPGKGARPAVREAIVVKLVGISASPAACVRFASALEQLDIFDRVLVKDTRSHALGRMSATHFEIEATLSVMSAPASPAPTSGAAP